MSVKSPIGRVAYPYLASARRRKPTDKARYSVCLVFPEGTDFSGLKELAKTAALKKFPNGIPKGLKSPFRSGEDREREDGTYPEGFSATDTYIDFWRYEDDGAPPVVGPNRQPILPGSVYAGCTGLVLANASAYSVDGNKGVSFHLEAFQFAADGERIGGSEPVNPETDFDELPGSAPAAAGAAAAGPQSVDDLW